jgi:hypothetical protein
MLHRLGSYFPNRIDNIPTDVQYRRADGALYTTTGGLRGHITSNFALAVVLAASSHKLRVRPR